VSRPVQIPTICFICMCVCMYIFIYTYILNAFMSEYCFEGPEGGEEIIYMCVCIYVYIYILNSFMSEYCFEGPEGGEPRVWVGSLLVSHGQICKIKINT